VRPVALIGDAFFSPHTAFLPTLLRMGMASSPIRLAKDEETCIARGADL
jgi:hypothetical protein